MEKLYSEEFEKCLLACMLQDNSIIDDVNAKVKRDYFFIPKYGLFYEGIINLYSENNACDIVMLSQQYPKKAAEIAELTDVISSSSNYDFFASEIKKYYTARKYKSFAEEQIANLSNKNIDDILYRTDDFTNICMTDVSKSAPTDAKQMAYKTLERIQYRINHVGELTGLDTGFNKLNSLTDGFQQGDEVVIGARASIGKSAFSDQLCVNMASKGIKTATFSLEMTAEQIGERRISGLSRVDIKKIRNGFLTASAVKKIQDSAEKLFSYGDNLLLFDSDSISCEFNEICSKIRLLSKQGYKAFFIDHIGLVECRDKEGVPEWEKISYITKKIKQLANKLHVVIVLVCQLTRDSEGKEPQLNNLRGSGSIEQDANTVILLHRERQKDDEIMIPTKAIVSKDRNGACGVVELNFFPKITKFEEVSEEKNEFSFEQKKDNNKQNEEKDFMLSEDEVF